MIRSGRCREYRHGSQRFAEGSIVPITESVGVLRPEVRTFEVDQARGSASGPVAFVHVVTIPGANAETFRAVDESRHSASTPSQ